MGKHIAKSSSLTTPDNEADLLTKQLPHAEKRKGFVSNLLHHIFWPKWQCGEEVRSKLCPS